MVAFFSMEYAFSDLMPFAGGLGVLAADYVLECGKQGFPLVALGLAYQGVEKLDFEKKDGYYYKEFGSAKVYLLDGDEITQKPYGANDWEKIRQEAFLGFEGIKLLNRLGITPSIYHLNEGHTAFTILALLKDGKLPPIVATKHTILSVSGLYLSKDQFKKVLEMILPEEVGHLDKIFALGSDEKHPDQFSTNKLLLSFAARSNGVSVKHCETELEVHKNSPLIPITNGINPQRWEANISPQLNDEQLWAAHCNNRRNLINYVNAKVGSTLNPDIMTVVWARRLAEYKQPELIISDLEKLSKIPAQFIIAGAASPADPYQISVAEKLGAAALNPILRGKLAYLPHYDLETSKVLVAGADVWLNTPKIGMEACGTSGMKAGLNGALILSTPDGWVCEEDWSHGGGWILGDVYEILSNSICPLFSNTKSWVAHMRLIMNLIRQKYTTARMLEDYKNKLYSL